MTRQPKRSSNNNNKNSRNNYRNYKKKITKKNSNKHRVPEMTLVVALFVYLPPFFYFSFREARIGTVSPVNKYAEPTF